eukprot:scaffold64160_cov65-Phaeocystis_antarctica.AAC.2
MTLSTVCVVSDSPPTSTVRIDLGTAATASPDRREGLRSGLGSGLGSGEGLGERLGLDIVRYPLECRLSLCLP